MIIWGALIGTVLAIFAGGLLYISFRAARFPAVLKLTHGRKGPARLLCLAVFSALAALLWALMNMMNAVVCLIHLVLFWMVCDIIAFAAGRIRKKQPAYSLAGIAALVLCVLWLAWGWVADHHVWEKDYTFETAKVSRETKLVQITDVHVGATFHADGFSRHLERINALKPDMVVVTGDFVDDSTSREDMLGACRALGQLDAPCGVFFVFGNHDRGYMNASSRGWTGDELRSALLEAGVTVLEDETAEAGEVLIAGRKDRSAGQRGGRESAQELLSDADRSKYIVMLDHQPHDFDAEAAAGADLVLCGHTHGGQFIPINHVGEWLGENALWYGHERRQNTDFIVSSGISNWTFRFKTGCRSEFVLITLLPEGSGV